MYSAEFVAFLMYVRQLRFAETPDYAFLRQLFRDVFTRKGYTGTTFDWQEVPEATTPSQVNASTEPDAASTSSTQETE